MARVNVRTAYEREKEEPFFSTSSQDPLASWRISGIKGPLFEQWYFDSISHDGRSSFCLIFARDASYAALGHGHLRMEFDAVFPDGTHFNHADWMSEAALTDNSSSGGDITGRWTAAGRRYDFSIAADGSRAEVVLQGHKIQGSFTLRARAPANYPNGKTQDEAGNDTPTALCPKIHLVQVIPSGDFDARLKLDGRSFEMTGIGGHMHVWAAGSWFDTVRGWRMTRAMAGPFRLSLMQWTSSIDNQTYSSGFVTHEGKKVFGGLEISHDQDGDEDEKQNACMVRWKPMLESEAIAGVAGPHKDRSIGATLRFITAQGGSEYRFDLVHQQVAFSVNFGGGASGLTGFHSKVVGGRVDDVVHEGVAFANVCVLPEGWTKVYFFMCMILAKLTWGYVNILGINT